MSQRKEQILEENKMKQLSRLLFVSVLIAVTATMIGCSVASDWARRDFPTDGLQQAVEYRLTGKAGAQDQINVSRMRGVNENAPILEQTVQFDQMSGLKTEDVYVTGTDNVQRLGLNMAKIARFAGLSHFLDVESATYSGVDAKGSALCAARVRLTFTRNLIQYADPNQRDYDALWFYSVPCSRDGYAFKLDLNQSQLRNVVINEVWQARAFASPIFWNWGRSVTVVPGAAAKKFVGGWWTNFERSDSNDAMSAAKLTNAMVLDLESSPQPWLEFSNGGQFSDSYPIYSAGDADKYATWDRILLNRQTEWAVFYRPDRKTPWDYVRIQPIYNWEWNLAVRDLANLKGWGDNPLGDQLNDQGYIKNIANSKVQALERVGFANAPNPTLAQVRIIDPRDKVLYAISVRAFIGAADSLILFNKNLPGTVSDLQKTAPRLDQPRPLDLDQNGKPKAEAEQTIKEGQWPQYLLEMSLWQYIKDPKAFPADLKLQYRFQDNTTWAPITCTDSKGNTYTCGYTPVQWAYDSSYFWQGDSRAAWLVQQIFGEVGIRTLGFSYASGPYLGTGIDFALAQGVLRDKYISGYTTPEDLLTLDCRACQYTDTLAEAWKYLHTP